MAAKKKSIAGKSKSGPAPRKVGAAAAKPAPVKAKAPIKAAPAAKVAPSPAPAKKPASNMMEFIGSFPIRRSDDDKRNDQKKQPTGPVFNRGDYIVGSWNTGLGKVMYDEFQRVYLGRHNQDTVTSQVFDSPLAKSDKDPASKLPGFHTYSRELYTQLQAKKIDIVVQNMKDVPLVLPEGLVLVSTLKREDPRDAMVTRSTYGAIQELPTRARAATTSKRRIMQIKALRPDIEIVPIRGDIPARLDRLEEDGLDAVILSWASLRRLNLSPRYYVALQSDFMVPAACQGIVAVVCRADDADLVAKLRYVEDSEASWASRCERAFLQKIGGSREAPVGAFAHRKGTQDPWILDTVIGDPQSGELIRHREIGTSRCKPESLADKAFTGILSKGARKFLPFRVEY